MICFKYINVNTVRKDSGRGGDGGNNNNNDVNNINNNNSSCNSSCTENRMLESILMKPI